MIIDDPDKYLHDCTTIEPILLEEEYVRLSADLAYWGEQYALAQRDYLRAKHTHEKTHARLFIAHHERLTANGKATEALVKAHVSSDPELEVARARMIEAEYKESKLKTTVEAIRTKKDMLVSLGAHVRAEIAGDPIVRAAHAGASEMRRNGR